MHGNLLHNGSDIAGWYGKEGTFHKCSWQPDIIMSQVEVGVLAHITHKNQCYAERVRIHVSDAKLSVSEKKTG